MIWSSRSSCLTRVADWRVASESRLWHLVSRRPPSRGGQGVAHGSEERSRKGEVFLNALTALAASSSSCNLWSHIVGCVCVCHTESASLDSSGDDVQQRAEEQLRQVPSSRSSRARQRCDKTSRTSSLPRIRQWHQQQNAAASSNPKKLPSTPPRAKNTSRASTSASSCGSRMRGRRPRSGRKRRRCGSGSRYGIRCDEGTARSTTDGGLS